MSRLYNIGLRKMILISFLISTRCLAQTDCDTIQFPKLLESSYHCKWTYFAINQPIVGVVIEHRKASVGCGTIAAASLTMIKTDADTFRVLGLCNENIYPLGQKVKVTVDIEPLFQVHLPCAIRGEGRTTGAT